MRKIILFALLATAAVPALAGAGRGGGSMGFGGGSMRASSSFGGFGGAMRASSSFRGSGERAMRASSFGGFGERGVRASPSFDRPVRAERAQPMFESGRAAVARDMFAGSGGDNRRMGASGQLQRAQPMRDWRAQGPQPGTVAVAPNWTGTQPSYSGRAADVGDRWRTDWRSNQQYDWRNYRDSHRSIFRLGSYYDPYGYGYRRFSIGFNLWPSYYGSNFWISDPWMYRLPPAPPGMRWVRYWDDAVLVDMWSGQVVDVIYNFFW